MPVQIFTYLKGILQGSNITATFLSLQYGYSHDRLTRFLSAGFSWKKVLFRIIMLWFGVLKNGYLIIDDTVLAKPYGKKFQKACYAYSSCLDKVVYGYHIVLLVWTNGFITIPLSFRFYQKGEKSKVALAGELLKEAKTFWRINPMAVLFDSWYGATKILNQIKSYRWIFYCQIKKNRVINAAAVSDELTENGDTLTGPLTGKCMGFILRYGDKFFTTNNLLVSSQQIIQSYRLRWKIEEIFRFLKSKLHLEECQARSITAQQTHLVSCMIAYLLVQKEQQNLPDKTLYQIKDGWLLNKRLGNNRIKHYVVKELLIFA